MKEVNERDNSIKSATKETLLTKYCNYLLSIFQMKYNHPESRGHISYSMVLSLTSGTMPGPIGVTANIL